MPDIDIRAYHTLSQREAREAADALAEDLASKFDIDYGWDGDTLVFERTGVDGEITVDEASIHVQARLGFMLSLLRTRVEDEIRRYLENHFGCTFNR